MKLERIKVATRDNRGSISDIMYKGEFQHAAIIESIPLRQYPIVRGNHFHKQTEQHIYIINGSLTYWYSTVITFDEDSHRANKIDPMYFNDGVVHGEVKNIDVPKGCLVSSPAYEIHALEIWEPTTFIVFSNGLRGGKDYESDTFRVTPILTDEIVWNRR